MNRSTKIFGKALLACSVSLLAGTVQALPVLQLGPTTAAADWSYNTTTATWDFVGASDSTANLSAFANATGANGGNGAYGWDVAGAANQFAYLVVAAVPNLGDIGDLFDITLTGATLFDSGYGNPPVEDPNDLPPHGIYETYFEIYQFRFDGAIVDIENTETGGDTAKGYQEDFTITINDINELVTGLHFDLYTVKGNGLYTPGQADDRHLVKGNAPFSHDAQWNPEEPDDPEDPPKVPVPGTALLLGLGLAGLRLVRRKAR